jgi:hypothetical protein
MSIDELAEWQAFYVIEPFGPIREDLRAGRMTAMIANTIPRERGSEPFSAEDFFPELGNLGGRKRMMSKEEHIAAFKMWAISMGARPPKPAGEEPEAKG